MVLGFATRQILMAGYFERATHVHWHRNDRLAEVKHLIENSRNPRCRHRRGKKDSRDRRYHGHFTCPSSPPSGVTYTSPN
jgi:hypothetical protein